MVGTESIVKPELLKYVFQACQIPSEPGEYVQRGHSSVFVAVMK